MQRDAAVDDPAPADLHQYGTVASILRFVTAQDGTHHLVVQGERRFRVLDFQPGMPFHVARVEYLPLTSGGGGADVEARALNLRRLAREALELLPAAPAELAGALQGIESPDALADVIAGFLDVRPADKQVLLETIDVRTRLERVATLLAQRIEVLRLTKQIQEQTREAIDEKQKEVLLREQLKQIQRELGESDDGAAEIAELRTALEASGMPAETLEHVRKELRRLERTSE